MISGIPRSTYYYHSKKLIKKDKYENIKREISNIFHENKGLYGYPRITLVLRKKGFQINHKTVYKLMKEMGLKSIVRPKKYRSYKGNIGKVAPNLINRKFEACKPLQKLATDITQINICGEKIYLSPVLDMFNSEIIAYDVSRNPDFNQVLNMLNSLFKIMPNGSNAVLHSDQGWQYQHKRYQHLLKEKGIRQSMSRKGNCLDNSIMENFFAILKSEFVYIEDFSNVDEFISKLDEYILYYNNKRIKSKLKGLSPVEYRIQSVS